MTRPPGTLVKILLAPPAITSSPTKMLSLTPHCPASTTRSPMREDPAMPTSPHSIAVHPTRPVLIVATYDADSASVIDTNTNKVLATIPGEQGPA